MTLQNTAQTAKSIAREARAARCFAWLCANLLVQQAEYVGEFVIRKVNTCCLFLLGGFSDIKDTMHNFRQEEKKKNESRETVIVAEPYWQKGLVPSWTEYC